MNAATRRSSAGTSRLHSLRQAGPQWQYSLPLRRSPSTTRTHVATPSTASETKKDEIVGPSTDISVIYARLQRLVLPYWTEEPSARWRLAGVVGLTLATTGVSVVFSFLGRDFYNALSERDVEGFKLMIVKYLAGFVLGIPVFVYTDYLQPGAGEGAAVQCCRTTAATQLKQRATSRSQPAAQRCVGGAVRVWFNFLGRDFYNYLSDKNIDAFNMQLVKYLASFGVGIPVFVFKAYYQQRLALEWREWMTAHLLKQYFADRSFYQLQAGAIVDNPDQRIASDVRQFTDAALGLSLTILNSLIDLVSFSGILYSIYPPLFAALLAYSIGGTLGSIALGKSLVGLNFNQEAVEADMRYGLVRVRENAESIAFYGGQNNEMAALMQRLRAVVANYGKLLIASRNLDFFTSFYKFLIQLLPAAVVAPLFFAGKIEFGVITQSSSAFNHILNDVSLVVYQFETLAGFSAVVDRLGEFQEVVDDKLRHTHPRVQRQRAAAAALASTVASASALQSMDLAASPPSEAAADGQQQQQQQPQLDGRSLAAADLQAAAAAAGAAAAAAVNEGVGIQVVHVVPWQDPSSSSSSSSTHGDADGEVLLEMDHVSINTPDGGLALVQDLSLKLHAGVSLLIMGPSGAGKTSVLRTLAGLWQSGAGTIYSYGLAGLGDPGVAVDGGSGSVLFLPQRPYMVLGSLRDQLLYPTWTQRSGQQEGNGSSNGSSSGSSNGSSGSRNGDAEGVESAEVAAAMAAPSRPVPADAELEAVLAKVQLGSLLQRCKAAAAAAAAVATPSDSNPSHSQHSTEQQQQQRSSTPVMTATSAPHAVLDPPPATDAAAFKAAAGSSQPAASALDYVADWSGMLSLGEQQRLAFARLLLAAPKLALLDEATSALDTKNEALLYQALIDSGSTVISVGHRPSLVAYHQQVLQLGGSQAGMPGKWQVTPAQELLATGAHLQ
ncbi:hypothetical protein OEZ85_011930 [Tetradesmus obliquus]|uniref:ABC transporter domain-containing protein n=1 Tax=Tetradesmus obliquus TaxID=3088 RepID=A0ABY8TTZ6_TETOB|nr:hypothetical protein OEZ85_011930 [Tetradesmus obliquus]